MSIEATEGLAALEQRVRHDLACLCYPPANWLPATPHAAVEQVHDVVVIGGGMCGLVASFALLGSGIRNLRIFDRNPSGLEGPWLTYARMETLRSPKQLTGPAYGMASLTFRAWYEAQYGAAAWEALDKIPRPMWMAYLHWYRTVLELPVENKVEVKRIVPLDGLLQLELGGSGAHEAFVLTRKVILATGREGIGYPTIPGFMQGLPRAYWAHSSDPIDFAALRGKRVVVVGVGASAVDNAAEALEAGAAEVRHLIRRKEMPRINKMMGIGSFGFSAGFPVLDDAWRWRFMHYSFTTQTPSPRGSTLRVSRHPNAYFHFDAGIERVTLEGSELLIETVRGARLKTDFIILGTGFMIDPTARTELDGYADKILLWRDRYTPPPELAYEELGLFPYLADNFAFQERQPGDAPWLQDIHCFNYGATLSLGKISGDIPAVSEGARFLAQSLAAEFYQRDIEQHWQRLVDYAKPELLGDEWTASEL
ncbi:MAG: NAD(P)/FAD-dependent oxidoreductase [Candidatus Competibacteraceae bacterium]|nr:NAD(P)/FAD-dependent oxidoreductase [Candidatus Competibacteraceae bacterium]MCB1808530.1 NAD(P)/FAD-dependent oxidoreductase [Candidatus Competibacteraceae bacterium]MCB1810374.1 NAD(P)/FAD-dependent oxidoreductase [Candidatus Competibacteraceae bacterium]